MRRRERHAWLAGSDPQAENNNALCSQGLGKALHEGSAADAAPSEPQVSKRGSLGSFCAFLVVAERLRRLPTKRNTRL